MDELTKKANIIRRDMIEMIHNSKAGHIGGDLSVADILVTLYFDIMNVSPKQIKDTERDRFILSKGHCVDALYCVLGEKGYFDKKEAIRTFSQYNSRYIGHPNKEVPGIEINSGSLGHGISIAAGMALAAKMNKQSYRTYVVVGDGEMAEGSNYEGMMAAGHYKLDNLCVTVDFNSLQISGPTERVMNSNSLVEKFCSFGFHVIEVSDGNNCLKLSNAYREAEKCKGKPSVVIAHTVKGKGVSFMENQASWHHGVMSEEQYQQAVKELEEVLV